jgi:transcriptional regulator of acetoin/glycerol metabolism
MENRWQYWHRCEQMICTTLERECNIRWVSPADAERHWAKIQRTIGIEKKYMRTLFDFFRKASGLLMFAEPPSLLRIRKYT